MFNHAASLAILPVTRRSLLRQEVGSSLAYCSGAYQPRLVLQHSQVDRQWRAISIQHAAAALALQEGQGQRVRDVWLWWI
jgi:hypothetical protein